MSYFSLFHVTNGNTSNVTVGNTLLLKVTLLKSKKYLTFYNLLIFKGL